MNKTKEIKLAHSKLSLVVDTEDFDELNKYHWHLVKVKGVNIPHYYAARTTEKTDGIQRTIFAHRQIMKAKKGQFVDHINHNTLDNTKDNLRLCTHSENQHNMIGCGGKKTSKYKGVHLEANGKKWHAQIKLNKTIVYIGLFLKEDDAARAYDQKAQELFGQFACLNFKIKEELL